MTRLLLAVTFAMACDVANAELNQHQKDMKACADSRDDAARRNNGTDAMIEYNFDQCKTAARAEDVRQYDAQQERLAKARNAKGGIRIGMSTTEVLASSWGKPTYVTRTMTKRGVNELWVYGIGNYLHFVDGVLTVITN